MKTISNKIQFSLLHIAIEMPYAFRFLLLTFSYLLLAANPTTTDVEPGATNIIYQSKDGGQTWQDISAGLPENEQPEGFFAGESDVYLRVKDEMYRSKSNLKTPVWEKENGIDARSSIAFNGSGAMAHTYDGKIYQKKSPSDPDSYRNWVPVYTDFKSQSVTVFFEVSDGTILYNTGRNFFKSADKARSWKLVQEGFVGEILESEGVLLAAGQKGIMRSTDKGEHWEWVVSEGGVGISIERIDGGFAAIAYNTQTKSRRIHISLDGGKTWQVISEGLQPSSLISSVKQMGKYLIVGHPDGIFRSSDMGKTWSMVHSSVDNAFKIFASWNTVPFNDDRKVFTIYVSGNVVYAVARNSGGC